MKPLLLTLALILLCPPAQADNMAELTASITDFMKPISKTRPYKKRLELALKLIPTIIEQCWAHMIDPLLVVSAIIPFESSWDPGALGERGECGYMQIMPGNKSHTGEDICDPRVNISLGVEMLANSLRACGTLPGALSYYGTGKECLPIARFVKYRLRAYKRAVKRFRK